MRPTRNQIYYTPSNNNEENEFEKNCYSNLWDSIKKKSTKKYSFAEKQFLTEPKIQKDYSKSNIIIKILGPKQHKEISPYIKNSWSNLRSLEKKNRTKDSDDADDLNNPDDITELIKIDNKFSNSYDIPCGDTISLKDYLKSTKKYIKKIEKLENELKEEKKLKISLSTQIGKKTMEINELKKEVKDLRKIVKNLKPLNSNDLNFQIDNKELSYKIDCLIDFVVDKKGRQTPQELKELFERLKLQNDLTYLNLDKISMKNNKKSSCRYRRGCSVDNKSMELGIGQKSSNLDTIPPKERLRNNSQLFLRSSGQTLKKDSTDNDSNLIKKINQLNPKDQWIPIIIKKEMEEIVKKLNLSKKKQNFLKVILF